jgi:hypothetical protein
MMAQYFNNASVQGAHAALPRITDLIDIIKFRQWPQLPQLPPRYTNTLGPSGMPSGTGPACPTMMGVGWGVWVVAPPPDSQSRHSVCQHCPKQYPNGQVRMDAQTPP